MSRVLKHHFRLSAFSDKDEGHSNLAGERKNTGGAVEAPTAITQSLHQEMIIARERSGGRVLFRPPVYYNNSGLLICL